MPLAVRRRGGKSSPGKGGQSSHGTLSGEPPNEHSDGIALSGSTLFAAVNARNQVAVVELSPDGASGEVLQMLTCEAFAFTTALAVADERLLVVNAQLDKMGAIP